jgi:hypothetical protein
MRMRETREPPYFEECQSSVFAPPKNGNRRAAVSCIPLSVLKYTFNNLQSAGTFRKRACVKEHGR